MSTSNTTPIDQGVSRTLFGTGDNMLGASSVSSLRVPPTPAFIGFSVTKTCSDTSCVAAVVAPYLQERFDMSDDQTNGLRTQLSHYFQSSGITNE